MSAAGSGWLGHIPRAGNQGRSRHATSCTGCAKRFLARLIILHDRMRTKTHGKGSAETVRNMLIHWVIC
jgi:hypothetical protein